MSENTFEKRWQANRTAWTFNQLQTFGIVMLVIAAFVAIWGYLDQYTTLSISNILRDFYANVSSELISIVITVLVLDVLTQRRQDQQELTRLKALLGSNQNVVTQIAVAELQARGWLHDGALKGSYLREANLSGLDLYHANLSGAYMLDANLSNSIMNKAVLQESNLIGANLTDIRLIYGNLSGSDLREASLKRAKLSSANLSYVQLDDADLTAAYLYNTNMSNADLWSANLQQANLNQANLQGTNLNNSDLKYANLANVECDEDTILPNGENWTPDVDWSQFGAVNIDNRKEWKAYKASLNNVDE